MYLDRFGTMFDPVISETIKTFIESNRNQLFEFERPLFREKKFDKFSTTHIFYPKIKHVTKHHVKMGPCWLSATK